MLILSTIIGGCLKNDRKYQKVFYDRYYDYVYKIVFRYIRSYSEVAYVVNTAFVKLLRNINDFKHHEGKVLERSLMEWAKKIVISTAIELLACEDPDVDADNEPQYVWKPESSTDLLYKDLICELRRLPWMHRAVFNMFVIDGYDHGEIAAQLNISEEASQSSLTTARSLLQHSIKRGSTQISA